MKFRTPIIFKQKFQERRAASEKGIFHDQRQKEWRKVISLDFMSSDESGCNEDNEVIISHPLPWLSPRVIHFKSKLDEAALKEKSPQSKRQMKTRVEGSPSTRPKPDDDTIPSWVFN